VKPYRERYGEKAFVSPAYSKRISTLMAKLREKHGIRSRQELYEARARKVRPVAVAEQMGLF
jgi:hypothetical protein